MARIILVAFLLAGCADTPPGPIDEDTGFLFPTGDAAVDSPAPPDGQTKSACEGVPVVAACDDGDPCTLEDDCEGGSCVATISLSCDDGGPCALGSCVAGEG